MKQLVDCCLKVCNELANCLTEIYKTDDSIAFDLVFDKEKVEKDNYRNDYLFYLECSGDMFFNTKLIDKIVFAKLSKEKAKGHNYTKIDYIFHYLPLPDDKYHEWYNGGWSSEYNEALWYAEELGLIEWVDEEDE